MPNMRAPKWDTSYEWKAVTLLGLGFGLVGLDRWIIAPLFPFMLKDLGLNIQDQGTIIGILSISYLIGDAAARQWMGLLIHRGVGWRPSCVEPLILCLLKRHKARKHRIAGRSTRP